MLSVPEPRDPTLPLRVVHLPVCYPGSGEARFAQLEAMLYSIDDSSDGGPLPS